MSSEAIRPSTLDGIKRLANSIKKQRRIKHAIALDDAAQAAGFQNFRHAGNVLRCGPRVGNARRGHQVFITVYWKDRDRGDSGRETLTLTLSCSWNQLVTQRQLQNHRALVHFRAEGPDHLARVHLQQSQSVARRDVCAAARALQFMDATKLRPSKSHSRAFPGGRSSNAIPGRDHYSIWYEAESRRYLFVDEPYEKAAVERSVERHAWAQQHGFAVVKPAWAGMYAPDVGSRLYLVAHETKGVPLQPVVAALNKLSPPVVADAWNGESAPMLPFFVSPGTVVPAADIEDKPLAASKPSAQRNSVGYVRSFVGPQRRPRGRMPIEAHAQVGQLLKSVLSVSYHRKGVYNRVNAIRDELDEWTQREYSHAELPNERFFELYHGNIDPTHPRKISEAERERHCESLTRAKNILAGHYPDCPPLKALLKKFDAVQQSLNTWV